MGVTNFGYNISRPRIIDLDNNDLCKSFDILAEMPELQTCIGCGSCTASCTAGNLTDFNFRKLHTAVRRGEYKGAYEEISKCMGGRYGPCIYDIVSFLWQAKADFSDSFRDEMIDLYIKEFSKQRNSDCSGMRTLIPVFVLFRTLQVLGAYGFRGLMQHKAHFIQSIPLAISNLAKLLKQGIIDEYPCLKSAINTIIESNRFKKEESSALTVEVFSFSYKKGYPDDFSGNGGGFMFDCRAMHNPGRYAEYKSLTGLDAPVIDFLEERGEIQVFLENAWSLTDPAIERYLQRGFTNIQIGFGCTGGQHRSVYSAENTAKHIAEKYPNAIVKLVHREQGITKLFNHTDSL